MSCCTTSITAVAPKVLRIRRPPGSILPYLYPRPFRRWLVTSQPFYQDETPEKAQYRSATSEEKRSTKPKGPSGWRSTSRMLEEDRHNSQNNHHIPFDSSSLANSLEYQHTDQSTMTDMERDTFAKLFGTLGSKSAQILELEHTRSHQRRADVEDQSYIAGLEDEIRGRLPDSHTSLDVSESIYDINQIYTEQLAPDVAASLDRYPVAIRDMARRAEILRTQEQERQKVTDPIILKAKEEMKRVEKLLLACKTDKQVWDVMQSEVFAKVATIKEVGQKEKASILKDTAMPTDTAGNASSLKQRSKSKSKTKQPPSAPTSAEVPLQDSAPPLRSPPRDHAEIKQLQILTHSYAPLLLLAVRLLLRRNKTSPNRPSALAPALLEAARAIGPTSYALAASTPLYNALLQHTWRSTAQYSSVFPLLHEMEQAGLSMDMGTLEVVDEMLAFRRAAGQGALGGVVCAVEEQMVVRKLEGQEVKRWRNRIWEEIKKKELERAYRDEERRQLQREEAVEKETSTNVVEATASAA